MKYLVLLFCSMSIMAVNANSMATCPDFSDSLKVIGNTSPHWKEVSIDGAEWVYGGFSGKLADDKGWNHVEVVNSKFGGNLICSGSLASGANGPMLQSNDVLGKTCTYAGRTVTSNWQSFSYHKGDALICK